MQRRRIMIIGYPSHAMTSRIHQEMLTRGHECVVIHPDRVITQILNGAVRVLPDIGSTDAVVLTTSTDHITAVHSAVHLQRTGVPVLNTPAAALLAADKVMTTVTLSRAGIPVPRTVSVASLDTAIDAAALLGYPLVLKAADGAEGNQTRQVPSATHLPDVFADLRMSMGQNLSSRTPLLLQEQLDRALGRDRRLFVVGGRVQAAMDRVARAGEWRSNLSQGATPLPAIATAEESAIAEAAARALGLDFTTIDLMVGPAGPMVIEANAFGDVLDVSMTSGLDLIGALADLVEMRAGCRAPGLIRPRFLTREDHANLTEMCQERLAAKRVELQQLEDPR